jgi:hypothetical protein
MFIVNIILKLFTSGSYAIIYIFATELFPTQARNTGVGFCSMISRIGAITGTLSNDALVRNSTFSFHIKLIYLDSSMASFAGCCLRYYISYCDCICFNFS